MKSTLMVKSEYDVTILKQDNFGLGVAKVENVVVFVSNGICGDVCRIKITALKKNFAYGVIVKMINPSSFRVIPKCPYYEACGGCHIMHENRMMQLKFKEEKVKELLVRFTGRSDIKFYPIIGGDAFYYRNKVIFHGNGSKLGFYKNKSNELVEINECMIVDKDLNKIYQNISDFIKTNSDNSIEEVLLRKSSLGKYLVLIKGNVDSKKIVSKLEMVDTIFINDILIKGKEYIEEEIDKVKFRIFKSSFFQVNYDMMLKLYGLVVDFYKNNKHHNVLDLYCGTGTIGMLVSRYADSVVGVEVEPSSIVAANIASKINNISNITFLEGKVEDKIDLFTNIDSIIVDPPRSGLDIHTVKSILKINPDTIVYISCDPVTLSRDLKLLLDDYNILEVHPVDMFPNTYHVECVSVLHRKSLEK